jgi:hypothetical protein
MPRRIQVEFIVLLLAVAGNGVVLYFVQDPAARLSLGLLALALIVWMSGRLGVGDLVAQPADKVHKRRFVRLRGQVQQLLDEIRRLNWMAVDAERGFRSREKALREMDSIEGRLKELIEEIRSTAGQMSASSEVGSKEEDEEAVAG